MKKILLRIVLLAVVLGAGLWGYRLFQQMPQRQTQVATKAVRRGDVIIRSFTRGELRAVRSATLTAPNLFGTVQVTRLAPLGAFAREKDLVIEFDDSEVNSRLEEKQLELDQIDEQIKKSEADLAIRNNQDQVELLTTRYSVRRAELDVKRNELLSAIDAKKNLLTLDESKRRLKQLESDIKSRLEQAQAELAVLHERKNKALLELAREKERLSQIKLLAPMSGLIAIRQNRPNFFFSGMQIPDLREGDQVQPGVPVADVLDLSDLELVARVGELDRANLHDGQDAIVELDALPDKKLHGKIKSMSGTASANIFSSDPAKKFDVVFSIDMNELLHVLGAKPAQIQKILATAEQNRKKPASPMLMGGDAPMMAGGPAPAAGAAGPASGTPQRQAAAPKPAARATTAASPMPVLMTRLGGPAAGLPAGFGSSIRQFSEKDLANAKLPSPPEEDSQLDVLLRPGLLADIEIIVEKIPNAIYIPVQAVFQKDGKLIAYVKTGRHFEERPIKPFKRSESTMVIKDGLKAGELVALADPYAKKSDKKSEKKSDGSPMGALPGGGK